MSLKEKNTKSPKINLDTSDPDNEDLPPAEECEKRCQEFASITGTDTALAMFYLQDRDWSLDVRITQCGHRSGTGRRQ